MEYQVIVYKKSMIYPDCWCMVFQLCYRHPFYYLNMGNCQLSWGSGECPYDFWGWPCCWAAPFPLGIPSYSLNFYVGPVNKGKYKVEIVAKQYPDWHCTDNGAEFGESKLVITDVRYVKVDHDAYNHTYWSSLYYLDPGTNDQAHDGHYIDAFTRYKIIAKIATQCNDESLMPSALTGHLRPDGAGDEVIYFRRWPQGDYEPPCHWWDFCYYTYAYISEEEFLPKELWYYSDEQWRDLKKKLRLDLYGNENHMINDASMEVWVQYLLYLDCLNDTTVCFVPANDERMQFLFTYSKHLLLNWDPDFSFQINDCNGEQVYKEQLIKPTPDPDDPTTFMAMNLFWDGRCNIGINNGHLADPELSPYGAFVLWNQGEGMTSNTEVFDAVPKIDSIIIAQEHWNPPPCPPPVCHVIYLNSIIVGKVDDVDPEVSHRYYLYGASQLPAEKNHRWNGMDYLFTDGAQPQYDFFEDREAANFNNFLQRRWKTSEWGNLRYEWWNINDQREGTSGMLLDYSDKRDTTDQWGDNWEACIEAPYDEEDRKRLLLFNIIEHSKNRYPVQACTSAIDEDAHKVIFGPIEGPYGQDNIYWSSTHIGVPYGYGAKTGYKHIDCSGFCVATQIQENEGPLMSHEDIIDLDNTNADMLVRDVKGGRHGLSGHIHTTTEIEYADAQRGDMIGLDISLPEWNHIANVAFVEYDPVTEEFIRLYIYEAMGYLGDMPGLLNRIRYENAKIIYIDRSYEHQIVRWDYE